MGTAYTAGNTSTGMCMGMPEAMAMAMAVMCRTPARRFGSGSRGG